MAAESRTIRETRDRYRRQLPNANSKRRETQVFDGNKVPPETAHTTLAGKNEIHDFQLRTD
jgi:hypothetical protein